MEPYKRNDNSSCSLKGIQILVNEKKDVLDIELEKHFKYKMNIEWVSPLKSDNYSEYRDSNFLEKLKINDLKIPLCNFWPRRGPQWDALGKDKDKFFIVEAKANIPEFESSGTRACENSKKIITKSLDDVKKYLSIDSSFNWIGKYYQYTNRIAHLYYLRELNDINAYLIFIYFYNCKDKGTNYPKTIYEWENRITKLYEKIGLNCNNPLSKYIIDIFIDYNVIIKDNIST